MNEFAFIRMKIIDSDIAKVLCRQDIDVAIASELGLRGKRQSDF
jgi:hypothetical protein